MFGHKSQAYADGLGVLFVFGAGAPSLRHGLKAEAAATQGLGF